MSQPTGNSQPRKKDDALDVSLERMQHVLASDVPGREGDWTEGVNDALERVETALRQHRDAANKPDGPLAEVDETRPTLARQADSLRSDHDEFLMQIHALRQEVQRVADSFDTKEQPTLPPDAVQDTDLGTIRAQARQLVSGLQDNKQAEVQLVLESVNTDIGVGD